MRRFLLAMCLLVGTFAVSVAQNDLTLPDGAPLPPGTRVQTTLQTFSRPSPRLFQDKPPKGEWRRVANTPATSFSADDVVEERLVAHAVPFFVPHWYIKAQAGAAYDLGEAQFYQLLSPALQLSMGYQLNETLGLRGALSGIWARNRYAYPQAKYNWNFLQPTVDVELNLTPLFFGEDPERLTALYLFAGGGVAFAWNNDDAVEADRRFGIDYQKLWRHTRWNPVVTAGMGVDFQITDEIALNAEVNGTMLPDHFNSKRGRRDNRDWHFNALLGVKFNIGKTHGRTEDIYERRIIHIIPPEPVAEPEPEPLPEPEPEPEPEEKIEFTVNINFVINQSTIRSNQMLKLNRLLRYLNEHPNAYVRLTGYADKATGTAAINQRLSQERSVAVSQWLLSQGIDEGRIRKFAHGDRIQPFDIPEDNRVTICFVYNPDDPATPPVPY